MPSESTVSKLKSSTEPSVSTREQDIAASHRKAASLSTYSNAYANFYEANPPEIHRLTTAQKMAAKEYFTNPAFRAKKNQTEIKNFVASVAGLPADTAEAFWTLMQHAPKGVSDKPLPDFSPAIEAGTSRRIAQSIGGDPDTVGFLLSQFIAPDPFGPVTSALAVGKIAGGRLNKLDDLAAAERLGIRETEFDLEIARETGWFKGMDGELKLLLDDSQAVVRDFKSGILKDPKVVKALEDGEEYYGRAVYKLDRLLDFPELYQAYPMLRDLPVNVSFRATKDGDLIVKSRTTGSVGGLHDTKRGDLKSLEIYNEERDYPFRETLMHEIEHAIQDIEGFARGGSSKVMHNTTQTLADTWERNKAFDLIDNGADTPDALVDKLRELGWDEDTITLTVYNTDVNAYMGANNYSDLNAMDEIRQVNRDLGAGAADTLNWMLEYLDPSSQERAIEQLRLWTRENKGRGLDHLFYRGYRNLKGEAEANFAGRTTGMQLEQILNENRLDIRQYGKDPSMGFGEMSPRTTPGQSKIVDDGAVRVSESRVEDRPVFDRKGEAQSDRGRGGMDGGSLDSGTHPDDAWKNRPEGTQQQGTLEELFPELGDE